MECDETKVDPSDPALDTDFDVDWLLREDETDDDVGLDDASLDDTILDDTRLEPATGSSAQQSPTHTPSTAIGGEELRISFACPECGHANEVAWSELALGMRCAACEASFDILPRGLEKRADPSEAEIAFVCPRCQQSDKIPLRRALHGSQCTSCGLQLFPGPDRKLHAADELPSVRRQHRAARQSPFWLQGFLLTPSGGFRPRVVVLGGGLVAMLCGLFLYWLLTPVTVDVFAQRFTRCLLAGQWDGASQYVVDDDYQRMQFQSWRIMYFASLAVALRSSPQHVEIGVTTVRDADGERVLRITMKSPLIGQRQHAQIWRETDGQWRFDAIASMENLHAADGLPVAENRIPAPET